MIGRDKRAVPSRAQWVALSWIRHGNEQGRASLVAGKGRTESALIRRDWAWHIDGQGWVLTRSGLEALEAGDRKYGLKEFERTPQLLAFIDSCSRERRPKP